LTNHSGELGDDTTVRSPDRSSPFAGIKKKLDAVTDDRRRGKRGGSRRNFDLAEFRECDGPRSVRIRVALTGFRIGLAPARDFVVPPAAAIMKH